MLNPQKLNPQNSFADTSTLQQVGECPHCQTLFAIPAEGQEASVLCPACEAKLSPAVRGSRTLPLARLAPIAPPLPEPKATAELAPSPQGLAGGSLLGGLIPEPAVQEAAPTIGKEKRSLSETLGWTPSEFSLQAPSVEGSVEGLVEEKVSSEPLADGVALANATPGKATLPDTKAPTLSEFRFDFGTDPSDGATPLVEESVSLGTELSNAETLEYRAEAVIEKHEGTVESVVDKIPPVVEWSPTEEFQTTLSPKKSWAGPLSAVAGLLVVGLPIGYLALAGMDSESLLSVDSATKNRSTRAERSTDATPRKPLAMRAEPKGVVAAVATLPSDKIGGATPASFDSAPTPPVTKTPETNDRYATDRQVGDRYAQDRYAPKLAKQSSEPNPFAAADAMAIETPTAEPPVMEPPLAPDARASDARKNHRLTGAPAYGLERLSGAVAEAVPAAKGFAEGTLSNEEEVPAMGQHYARLCYLAQVLTLMDTAEVHPDRMTQEFEAVDLFKRLFREEGTREDSRQIVGPWMTWSGRPHGGVFFAGTPDQTSRSGEVYEYRFPLIDGDVYVVTEEPLDAKRFMNSRANEVGVIGIVVEDPAKRIKGYEGTAERVIWARKTAPLPPAGDAR